VLFAKNLGVLCVKPFNCISRSQWDGYAKSSQSKKRQAR